MGAINNSFNLTSTGFGVAVLGFGSGGVITVGVYKAVFTVLIWRIAVVLL